MVFHVKIQESNGLANVLAKVVIKKENRDKDKIVVLGIPRGEVVTADIYYTKA